MTRHTRMLIMQAATDQAPKVLDKLEKHHSMLSLKPGFLQSRRMQEDGGDLIVLETDFRTREDALQYHASTEYRHLIATINPLLLGSPVVKLFTH